jgi:plasmid maintenance system killer protein
MNRVTYGPKLLVELKQAPPAVQKAAQKAFRLFVENERHPSLRFKKVGPLWSIRINIEWRILLRETENGYEALHLADHDWYEQLIKQWH